MQEHGDLHQGRWGDHHKIFCPDCGNDPQINPPKAFTKVFGLEDVTDMVNQEERAKAKRFKIKLKMS